MDPELQPIVEQPTPSRPGFGYVVLSFPQEATFKPIGKHFTLSYLPSALVNTPLHEINSIKICLWLGPGLHVNICGWTPFEYFLRAAASRNEYFSHLAWTWDPFVWRVKSTVVTLISDTGAFTDVAPNDIVRDLLYVNRQPCLLFIWWSGPPNSVVMEATKLSLKTLVLSLVGSLVEALIGADPELEGDAIQSPMVQRWYLTMLESLRLVPKDQFLFDPTRVAHGVVVHLGNSLMANHKFDIRSKPMLYIPMAFIRIWAEQLEASGRIDGGLDCVLKAVVS